MVSDDDEDGGRTAAEAEVEAEIAAMTDLSNADGEAF
jgi:hypothetical protein